MNLILSGKCIGYPVGGHKTMNYIREGVINAHLNKEEGDKFLLHLKEAPAAKDEIKINTTNIDKKAENGTGAAAAAAAVAAAFSTKDDL